MRWTVTGMQMMTGTPHAHTHTHAQRPRGYSGPHGRVCQTREVWCHPRPACHRRGLAIRFAPPRPSCPGPPLPAPRWAGSWPWVCCWRSQSCFLSARPRTAPSCRTWPTGWRRHQLEWGLGSVELPGLRPLLKPWCPRGMYKATVSSIRILQWINWQECRCGWLRSYCKCVSHNYVVVYDVDMTYIASCLTLRLYTLLRWWLDTCKEWNIIISKLWLPVDGLLLHGN